MDSQANVTANLSAAASMIEEAAGKGAKLIVLPETMPYIGRNYRQEAELVPRGRTVKALSELAKKYRLWINGGSLFERNSDNPERPFNTTFVIRPDGTFAAKYRKLHPFDVVLDSGVSSMESNYVCPGDRVVTVPTNEVGHLGLAVCYDTRFPEIFRIMALKGAQLFTIPANFTEDTGRAHWEVLLRARAIENECYVIAANQVGMKPRFTAYGHSMIIDPRGKILADAGERRGVIYAAIDLNLVGQVRRETFTLSNRRRDIYELKLK